jgi:glutamate carboxypeptidase
MHTTKDLLPYFKDRSTDLIEKLKVLVEYETPTRDKTLVDKLGQHLHSVLDTMHAEIDVFPREAVGDIRLAKWNASSDAPPIMMVGHLDTVWPEGTLAESIPIKITESHFHGPGALDMKAGVMLAIEAVRALQERDEMPDRPIWLLLTTDEERASVHSRDLIQELARQVGLVMVPEPAGEYEAIKTMRKGFARYLVRSEGVASHAGNAPESGVNAVIDSAHQALRLNELNDLPNGTSVTVTQSSGGISTNVVPPEAELFVDVRFSHAEEGERIDQAIKALEPAVLGAKLNVSGNIDRPPLERNATMIATYKQAKQIADALGLPMSETFSGGVSDGNFTASLGVPTLDGLGPEGQGMHALHEQVLLRSMPRRAALIAALLRDWQMSEQG